MPLRFYDFFVRGTNNNELNPLSSMVSMWQIILAHDITSLPQYLHGLRVLKGRIWVAIITQRLLILSQTSWLYFYHFCVSFGETKRPFLAFSQHDITTMQWFKTLLSERRHKGQHIQLFVSSYISTWASKKNQEISQSIQGSTI